MGTSDFMNGSAIPRFFLNDERVMRAEGRDENSIAI